MKAPIPENPLTVPSVDAPVPYVTDAAKMRLDTLRGAVDLRLEALEAALSDPSRGGSLEALILDLSRVAAEEAHATAVRACEDGRITAEKQIAQARAAAQSAIEHERATTAAIVEQERTAAQSAIAQEREASQALIEQEWKAAHASAERERTAAQALVEKERLTAQGLVERERTLAKATVEQERAVARATVEQERNAAKAQIAQGQATVADLSESLDAARQRIATIEQTLRERETALEQVRATAAEEQRDHAETRAQLAVERSATTELRTAAARAHEQATRATEQLAALEKQQAHAGSMHADLSADVERLQHENEQLRGMLGAQQGRLEEERSAVVELRRELAHAEARLDAAVESERAAVAEIHASATRDEERVRAVIEAERAAAVNFREASVKNEASATALGKQVAALRSTNEKLHASLETLQASLDAERTRFGALEQTQSETVAALEQARRDGIAELNAAKSQHARLLSDAEAEAQVLLDRVRQESESRLERERIHGQALVDAERETAAELQRALEQARHQLSVLVDGKDQTQMGGAESQEALAHSRTEVRGLRDELEAARTRIERLAGEQADAERNFKQSESRLKLVTRERDALVEQAKLQQQAEHARELAMIQGKAPELSAKVRKAVEKQAAANAEAEWAAVRMAVRYSFADALEVQINGGASTLVNLSVGGCQVISTASLKPNQAVKVALPHEPKALTCTGKVVWAKLEPASKGKSGGYRAGIEFSKADESAIEAFVKRHKGTA